MAQSIIKSHGKLAMKYLSGSMEIGIQTVQLLVLQNQANTYTRQLVTSMSSSLS